MQPYPASLIGLGLRAYLASARILTRTKFARMYENVTLVNSEWTGRQLRALHPVATVTCYPPAAGRFPEIPWAERGDGFVCVGRFARDKRYELLIAIVDGVRACGHDVRLFIVGAPDDRAYEDGLVAMTRERPWVRIERGLTRAELARLLASQRYGLHGKMDEHFGMAVAELVCAGAIPFVPDDGGQVEIVADPRLTWRTRDEAVAKIVHVLEETGAQESLRRHLAGRKEVLGADRFVRQIRDVVASVRA